MKISESENLRQETKQNEPSQFDQLNRVPTENNRSKKQQL